MKRRIVNGMVLAVALLGFNLNDSLCDVGNCVRYRIELRFDDDSRLTGFIQISSFDPMVEKDDSIFFDYLKKDLETRKRETFTLYKKIQTIEFPKTEIPADGFKYSAAVPGDIVAVNIDKIASIHLQEVSPCEHGDFPRVNQGSQKNRFLIHHHHWIIEELTQSEIDLLQIKPESEISRESPFPMDEFNRLRVLCYDPSISETELSRLCSKFYLKNNAATAGSEESYKRAVDHYNETKQDLRKKKIIALIIKGYN